MQNDHLGAEAMTEDAEEAVRVQTGSGTDANANPTVEFPPTLRGGTAAPRSREWPSNGGSRSSRGIVHHDLRGSSGIANAVMTGEDNPRTL